MTSSLASRNPLTRLRAILAVPWQRTLVVMFLSQLITSTGFSCFFPFLPLYVDELGSSTGLSLEFLAGLAFSAQGFTMMLASPLWGAVADRYGRKLMVERAAFGGAIVLLLMAFPRSAEELVLLRAVQGLITGTISAANALVAAAAPRERTGFAMGLLQVGLGAGVAVGPLIGGAVADIWGYRAAFYLTSALLLMSGLMVALWVKEEFHPDASPQEKRPRLSGMWREILGTPGVAVTYSMRFASQLGRMLLTPIAPLFIETLLFDRSALNTFTGLVTGAASATATISAVYLGRLGDRIGHRKVLVTSLVMTALLYLPQTAVQAGWQLLLLQALSGVALGGVIPSISALLAGYTRPGMEGVVYGLDNSIDAGSRSFAPLLGAGVAMLFGLRATFLATAVIFGLAGIVAAARLPMPMRGKVLQEERA